MSRVQAPVPGILSGGLLTSGGQKRRSALRDVGTHACDPWYCTFLRTSFLFFIEH